MRGALLSIALIGTTVLAACAAGGSRDDGGDRLEAPGHWDAGRTSASGPGLGSGSANSPAASVAFEGGGPKRERRAQERSSVPIESPAFDAGVLYAMAYLPSASGVETERANRLAELYADARPGYGLYTFILGGPVGPGSDADAESYAELLRVIETYVLGDAGQSGAGGAKHGFLLQVDPRVGTEVDGRRSSDAGLDAASLAERARPGLSVQMQIALARQLRMFGHAELADRLEHSDGPFLVTSLRSSLIPVSEQVPLLIIDLHELGPEYMYSLIDAYDRPIPGDLVGRPESLSAIGRRVQGMFPNRGLDRGAEPPPSGSWIWLIGAPDQANALAAISSEES